jgi:peroxiredoxin
MILPAGFESALGLAVASFVLGLVSISTAIFIFGGVFGLIGLVLGVIHVCKKRFARTMAVWGIVFSAIGLLGSAGIGSYYFLGYRAFQSAMPDTVFEEWVGIEAPDFEVTDLGGNTIRLSELKGKRVVIDLWATWCPPCRKEIPHFIKLRNETSAEELVIVGISKEDKGTLAGFVKENGINYPIASADDLPSPYGEVTSIPTTFFIDRNGIIQDVLSGYHSFDELKTGALASDYEAVPSEPEPAYE